VGQLESIARNLGLTASQGLYDVCLALHGHPRVVDNDIGAGNAQLVIITGANQGGRSTFLRSVGRPAHLIVQCGILVATESFAGSRLRRPLHALQA
jgi:DNA mismatch repair ATPase MutS